MEKNKPHNNDIDKDFYEDNIKPLPKKRLLQTLNQFKKNLKECGIE